MLNALEKEKSHHNELKTAALKTGDEYAKLKSENTALKSEQSKIEKYKAQLE